MKKYFILTKVYMYILITHIHHFSTLIISRSLGGDHLYSGLHSKKGGMCPPCMCPLLVTPLWSWTSILLCWSRMTVETVSS